MTWARGQNVNHTFNVADMRLVPMWDPSCFDKQ